MLPGIFSLFISTFVPLRLTGTDMQTLLNDIELDIQELKCLLKAISSDTNPALRIVAKRNIYQMQERLNALMKQLDETVVFESTVPAVGDAPVTPISMEPIDEQETIILAERIKPATDLRHAISLNDSFRFTRELFDGDAVRMNEVISRLGKASSLDEALDIFMSTVHFDQENVAFADFVELLKKYFN